MQSTCAARLNPVEHSPDRESLRNIFNERAKAKVMLIEYNAIHPSKLNTVRRESIKLGRQFYTDKYSAASSFNQLHLP